MKSLSISLVMALAGATMGFAGTTVWSVDKQKGNDMQPAYWYSYAQPEATATGVLNTTTEGYVFTTALDLNSETYSVAGFGFAWKQTNKQDVDVDLSSYSGLCVTYKADRQFRLDLKQSGIGEELNYYGDVLPAQATLAPVFVDFSKIAQEPGWGQKFDLDLTKQVAIQMSYKAGLADGVAENVITIASVSLGDCEETPVESGLKLLEPYDKAQTVSVKESETL